jgi:ABC-2 type transport system ATP-binding protein
VVPQELVFDPFFNVRELLRIQAGYFNLGRANDDWIDELLEALQLTPQADTNMRALSGGMKRRVLIAQALVHKPEVVVLDEPTAGVDVELRQLLWVFIRRLHREGHTIVLTTHYLEEAEELCQRIAIINHGELVALDRKDALLRKMNGARGKLTVYYRKAPASLPDALASRVLLREEDRVELRFEKGSDSLTALLDALRAAGAEVTDLKSEEADLEDVFVALLRRGRK